MSDNYGFNMYDKGDVTEPVGEAFDQTYGKMEERARKFFGGGQGAKIRGETAGLDRSVFQHAVNTFGVDAVMNWNEQSGYVMKALNDDLRNLKRQGAMASRQNDLARYQMYLQQSLHDKEMMEYAKALSRARIGEAISGVLGFISSIAGMGLGEISGQNMLDDILNRLNQEIYRINVPNQQVFTNAIAPPNGPNATNVPPGGGGYF